MTLIGFKLKPATEAIKISGVDRETVKLAEFGRICAGLIHEISTPLTAANLTLAQLGNRRGSVQIIQQVRRELKLLERYVIAARLQLKGESMPTTFSLTIVIHQIEMLLEAKAMAAEVRLLINTKGSIRIYGDRVKFAQIMTNLINNAIESYEESNKHPRFVRVNVKRKSEDSVTINVRDYGIGISYGGLKRIFEPLYSTKTGAHKGMGIGLSNVKSYVEEDFGGSIKVHSIPGMGTNFTLTIPIRHS